MTTNCTIRRAESNDVNDFYSLICELENREFEFDKFSKCFEDNLMSWRNIYLVAIQDSSLLGILTCHSQTLLHHLCRVYEIQELIVKEDCRSRGIGGQLLAYLEDILQNEDCEMLEVASNLKRKRAHEFYLGLGFEQSHYKFTKSMHRSE